MSIDSSKLLLKEKNYKDAKESLNKLSIDNPNDLRTNFLLGRLYYDLNDLRKSLFYFDKCNNLNSGNSNVLFNLALVLQSTGEVNKAKDIYNKLIKINITDIKSYYGLFKLDIENINNEFYQNLLNLLNNKKISLLDKSLINFIISKIKKKEGDIKSEIEYLNLAHEQCYNSNLNFNVQSDFYYKKIIPKYFDKICFNDEFEKLEKFNDLEHIFIIGLPRSGSSLIETIIMHNSKKVFSVGEFHGINTSIFDQISKTIYSKDFKINEYNFSLNKKKFQNRLIQKYDNFNNDRFLDKSLENFFNIEIILKFFPKAKFIHTRRNFKDSVIGIYQTMLTELSWSHNIQSIKNYISTYLKVISYYKEKYPNQIIDVDLDNFFNEKEVEVKKLLNFLNIDFSENYLEFEQNKNLFNKTNSFLQVRQNIKKYENKKYLPYYFLLD